jgi:protein-disulfide isomerase
VRIFGVLLSALLCPVACHATTPASNQEGSASAVTGNAVPVEADDGTWGAALAPVTLVVFTDLRCPFCAQGHELIQKLEQHYGPLELRVVVKQVPLASHAGAIPAARVAQAVLELGGNAKFFEYLDRAFARQDQVAGGNALELALPLGIDAARLAERAGSAAVGQQVLNDTDLAERLAVPALPHLRINGRGFTGVHPYDTLVRAIDRELAEVRRLTSAGIPKDQVYSRRVAQNLNLPEPD